MEDKSVLDTLEDAYLELVDGAVAFLPKLLVALLLLFAGLIIARFTSRWVGKLVDYFEKSKPVVSTMKGLGLKAPDVDGVVSIFFRWAVILVFLSAAVDVLGLQALTDTFDALVDFVPNILAASAIAGLSFVAGSALHDIVLETSQKARLSAANFLAGATRVAVLVFGLPLAAAQLGLDLSIITNNLTVVVAGIMLAFGLAFGLGGREVAGKVVNDLYNNWKK
ncbi:MAG: hypothetical protein R3313_01070 [Candidatus Saccharimonadales bacterium]|nr:hypothetical protein [Candidatus Saccharimonadales bacterium]